MPVFFALISAAKCQLNVQQQIMAQHNDRWASRILSLPVFDDSFAKAVQGSPFANLAFVAAMEVKTAHEFVAQVTVLVPGVFS